MSGSAFYCSHEENATLEENAILDKNAILQENAILEKNAICYLLKASGQHDMRILTSYLAGIKRKKKEFWN